MSASGPAGRLGELDGLEVGRIGRIEERKASEASPLRGEEKAGGFGCPAGGMGTYSTMRRPIRMIAQPMREQARASTHRNGAGHCRMGTLCA